MAYVCKNCGKIITEKEYKKEQNLREQAHGCGCFLIGIIILCFVSVVLIPIAIILLVIAYNKEPKNECPYCNAKDSLIPDNTPIAQKLIAENYSKDEVELIQETDRIEIQREKNKMPSGCLITLWIIGIYILIAFVVGISESIPK